MSACIRNSLQEVEVLIMAGLGYIQYGWTIITWTIWMYNNYMDKEVWLDWEWNPGHVKAG